MADSDIEYLQSIPWCAKILGDPSFVRIPTSTRQFKESTEDTLFAETLKTDDTIRAWVAVFRQPTPGATKIEEVRTIITLGYRLNGYPHLCHGGVVATIMDEVMGTLCSVNKRRNGIIGGSVTASLSVSFLKPVRTPQVVLVTANFGEIKGRKSYVESSMKASDGIILAKAEALFIRIDDPKERL
ncbi:hypothetical protein MMC18_004671 [Xylographa bjoerkii]|nr:hypothetical protein [Xylographa bjoerkii]